MQQEIHFQCYGDFLDLFIRSSTSFRIDFHFLNQIKQVNLKMFYLEPFNLGKRLDVNCGNLML